MYRSYIFFSESLSLEQFFWAVFCQALMLSSSWKKNIMPCNLVLPTLTLKYFAVSKPLLNSVAKLSSAIHSSPLDTRGLINFLVILIFILKKIYNKEGAS
jgi:hypothetical protein